MHVLAECNQLAQKRRIYFGDPCPPIETVIYGGRVSTFLFQFLIDVKVFDKIRIIDVGCRKQANDEFSARIEEWEQIYFSSATATQEKKEALNAFGLIVRIPDCRRGCN